MKMKSNIHLDKLTMCYTVDTDSILQNINDKREIDLYDFKLIKIDSKHFNNAYNILFVWDYDDKTDWYLFGTLKFNLKIDNNDSKTIQKAWIYFNNRDFYTEYCNNMSIIVLTEILENLLGLSYNNITSLDIAYDCNKNIVETVFKMIRNKDIETILNNDVIKDRNIEQPNIIYILSGSLNKYKKDSIYFKQSDKDGFRLSLYNKKKEIENSSHKTYIEIYNKMPKKMYRAEIRLKNEHIRKYLVNNNISISYNLLNNTDFLQKCFNDFSERLIRFRKGRKVFNIIDVIKQQP